MALVSLRDVRFTYAYTDSPALDGITLELEPGLLHGVVGMNASGKSTLCALIRGIIPHFHEGTLEGEVRVLGKGLLDWDPAELSQTVGCVFDNPFTQISGIKDTVFEEIAMGLENLGVPRDEMIERVEAVVERLGLQALIRKNPNELSGGQRQKVAFASIIAMDTDFIVIDEPTSQLDPEASEAVFGIIGELKNLGKSIVLGGAQGRPDGPIRRPHRGHEGGQGRHGRADQGRPHVDRARGRQRPRPRGDRAGLAPAGRRQGAALLADHEGGGVPGGNPAHEGVAP
jgi:energy-coupling factor transport system ATP-binding protein